MELYEVEHADQLLAGELEHLVRHVADLSVGFGSIGHVRRSASFRVRSWPRRTPIDGSGAANVGWRTAGYRISTCRSSWIGARQASAFGCAERSWTCEAGVRSITRLSSSGRL